MPGVMAYDQRSDVREWLVQYLRRCITTGDFELAGGARTNWYLDCRDLLYGVEMPTVAMLVDRELVGYELDAIGGVGYGGLPLGLHLAYRRGVKSFAVRLEPKGHGRTGKVMGPVLRGNRVALIEDVFTTGSSVCAAVEALRDIDVNVAAVVCLVNRGNPTLRTVYGDIPFHAVLTTADLEI